ncbi:hypothetical protein [Caproiciproducens sp.]
MERSDFTAALKNIQYRKSLADRRGNINGINIVTADSAIEALEKQIPKKPIENISDVPVRIDHVMFRPGIPFYTCLICGTPAAPTQPYCIGCGQRFDWDKSGG